MLEENNKQEKNKSEFWANRSPIEGILPIVKFGVKIKSKFDTVLNSVLSFEDSVYEQQDLHCHTFLNAKLDGAQVFTFASRLHHIQWKGPRNPLNLQVNNNRSLFWSSTTKGKYL